MPVSRSRPEAVESGVQAKPGRPSERHRARSRLTSTSQLGEARVAGVLEVEAAAGRRRRRPRPAPASAIVMTGPRARRAPRNASGRGASERTRAGRRCRRSACPGRGDSRAARRGCAAAGTCVPSVPAAEHQAVAVTRVHAAARRCRSSALVSRVVHDVARPRSRRRRGGAKPRTSLSVRMSAPAWRGGRRGRCGRACSWRRSCSPCRTRRTAGSRAACGRGGSPMPAPGSARPAPAARRRRANVTASGGSCQSRPSRSAASSKRARSWRRVVAGLGSSG